MTLALLKNKFHSVRNLGTKLSAGQKVTAVLFQLIIVGFLIFLGACFTLAFKLLTESLVGMGAVVYLLDHLFFLIFALAVMSGAISSLFTMFKAKEIEFLMSLPLRPGVIFDYLLIQNIIFNTWPVFIVGLPLVAALTIAFKVPLLIGMVMWAGLLPLTFIAEALGALVAVVGTRIFSKFHGPFVILLTALAGIAFSYLLADAIAPTRIESSRIDRLWLPNHWLSMAYRSGLEGRAAGMAGPLAVLIAMALAALGVARGTGARVYFAAWLGSRSSHRTQTGVRRAFPRFAPGLKGALIERDYLAFSRSSNEISQAFFFLMLVTVLVFILSRYPALGPGTGVWRYRAVVLLFGVIAYYLTMLANRFVFPLLSLEGRSFWILLSSPLRLTEIFRAKLAYSVAILALLGGVLALVSAYFFRVPGPLAAVMLLWVIEAAAVVAVIALAGGTLYPDFSRQSAAEISSGFAGLAATVASLAYGAAATALFAPVVAAFYLAESRSVIPAVMANLGLTLAVFIWFRYIALKKLADFHL